MASRLRPQVIVLAGVNGAGKSSVGGQALRDHGLGWYNPDTYTRELQAQGYSLEQANAMAWTKGRDDLQAAIDRGLNHALETTLGGSTIARLLAQASASHDVHIWYCGLATVQLHLDRVALRVSRQGHDIPAGKIRARYLASPLNLVALMPRLASLSVFDNSKTARPGEAVPDPVLVLRVQALKVLRPDAADAAAMAATPGWARPLVAAALDVQDAGIKRRR